MLWPEVVDILVPILPLFRHAPALLYPEFRLNVDSLLMGSRRFALLARTACAGLLSLLTPRVGPFLFRVDCRRKSRLPRWVNLEPSIPVEFAEVWFEGLPVFMDGLTPLMVVERRATVLVPSGALTADGPASLLDAFIQRPSISPALLIAHPSKSSEAEAGRAAVSSRSRNNGTIDTLM